MILEAIQIDKLYLIVKSILIGILWLCVVLAFLLDLYHGIKKSKAEGKFTNSSGLKRTVAKGNSYLTFMLFMLIGDTVLSVATSTILPFGLAVLPVLNIVGALVLIRTEWISVREKADQKMLNRINQSGVELSKIMVEALALYKNNPEALNELIKKYDENKKTVNEN